MFEGGVSHNVYGQLADEAGHTYSQAGLTGLWKKLKAVLPKNKLKQTAMRYDIQEEMLHHFEQLEAGTTVHEREVLQMCRHNNRSDLQAKPTTQFFDLTELPTLYEIEEMCLKQKPHKAPGPDGIPSEFFRSSAPCIAPGLHNLLLKSILSSTEPCRFKGGHLQAIWKQKGSPRDPTTYRGILLADSYAKIQHAWVRSKLLPTLVQRHARGQIGGLPAQQTATAMQILRLHGGQARHCKMSSAVLFIDLKAAFHHLLRELLFIRRQAMTQEALDRFIDPRDFDTAAIAHLLETVCQHTPEDIPPALREYLHDLHRGTWFKFDPQDTKATVTTRGTRPGSPMADIGFNMLMARIMEQIENKLGELPLYAAGQESMNVDVPPISWVDDLAIPIATCMPSQLLPLLDQVTCVVHDIFRDHGLTMNFDAGKTEAVVMFRGAGANQFRTATFDKTAQPCLIATTPTHVLTLRIVASYKHLGARVAMDAELDQEINQRTAAARKAFEELKRPVFKNKAIGVQGRQQLYHSLVASRLLYGSSVWSDVSAAQVKQIETVMIDHHRRIHDEGFWRSQKMSDEEFIAHSQLVPFRILWARNRLIYLQSLTKHGRDFHIEMLMQEFDRQRGWLWEVCDDLKWMSQLVDLPFSIPSTCNEWREGFIFISQYQRWKALVGSACRRHLVQEQTAVEIKWQHDGIVKLLRAQGCEVIIPEETDDTEQPGCHGCGQCAKKFETYHALATHMYQKHGTMSLERPYIQSTTCAGCLKDFHTTWRVQQHLRYRPNGCWDKIYGARQPSTPVTIELATHLKGIKRLPAIRRQHGPLRPTSVQRQRISLRQRIAAVREQGADEYAWWFPSAAPALTAQACAAFDQGIEEWCADPDAEHIAYQNVMFGKIFELEIPDLQGARLYIHWAETRFYDQWPEDLDPDRALCLDRANELMLEDLPTWQTRHEMARLTQLWVNLPPDEPTYPRRQEAVQPRPYCRTHPINRKYQHLPEAEQQRSAWHMYGDRVRHSPSSVGPYFIIHLYSGHRREGDFQQWMEHYLAEGGYQNIYVLSLDTAVDPAMNIHSAALWQFIMDVIQQGRCLGILLGPPCETWSAARHHALRDSDGVEIRGPRPLRHGGHLWGLEKLTWSELQQLRTGNILLLKGLHLACAAALRGTPTFVEHPAPPYDGEMASIWRLGLLKMIQRPPRRLFSKLTIHQWKFGSKGIKPTVLMYSNAGLEEALALCEDHSLERPTEHLLGKAADGEYKTACAKEYPTKLNQSFALAIKAKLTQWQLATVVPGQPVDTFGKFLAEKSAQASTKCGHRMPDYQPR